MKNLLFTILFFLGTFYGISQQVWDTNGNNVSSEEFLGTTNDMDLIFKRNGLQIGRLTHENILLGLRAGSSLPLYLGTNQSKNIAIGVDALRDLTTGDANIAIGTRCLQDLVTGSANIGIGTTSSMNGDFNTTLGSVHGVTGDGNVIIGYFLPNSLPYSNFSKHIILAENITGKVRMVINDQGKVLFGDPLTTTMPGDYRLYVDKGILTEKVKVALKTTSDWSDYIFYEDYELMPLVELEKFINEYGHLPNVPSAEKLVEQGGIDLGKMQAKQMAKIEELTLHLIQKDKEIKASQKQIQLLQKQIGLLSKQVESLLEKQ